MDVPAPEIDVRERSADRVWAGADVRRRRRRVVGRRCVVGASRSTRCRVAAARRPPC